jgi:transcriptional regulator with XRE-family HTH domain
MRSKNKKDFTQFAIAKKCGYTSSQHISNIERGLTLPSLSLAVKLMKFYGIEKEAMYDLFMRYRQAQYKKVFLSKK